MNSEILLKLNRAGFEEKHATHEGGSAINFNRGCEFCWPYKKESKKPSPTVTAKNKKAYQLHIDKHILYVPTLGELIDACGPEFEALVHLDHKEINELGKILKIKNDIFDMNSAAKRRNYGLPFLGEDDQTAVGKLWLATTKK